MDGLGLRLAVVDSSLPRLCCRDQTWRADASRRDLKETMLLLLLKMRWDERALDVKQA